MLDVNNIHCHYDRQAVLSDLSFHIAKGEIGCLLGPSGCGKTTALRAIAGFQALSQGQISLQGQLLSSPERQLEPERRRIGMVFQDYALFPHLTVRENIRFGISALDRRQQQQTIADLLSLIKLQDIDQRYPHELSGGQQQRVALARALAPGPKLLLLDEPFSNLDVELRRHLQLEVRDILKNYGISAILVTHDQDEAFAFGDSIGLLDRGQLQQWDSAYNLFHNPSNRFVANFIGQGQLLDGQAIDEYRVLTELGELRSEQARSWPAQASLDVLLRPSDIVVDTALGIDATVTHRVFSGSGTLYGLQLASGHQLEALLPHHANCPIGGTLKIRAKVDRLIAFTR